MFPIKELRLVKTGLGMKLKNVCIGKNGKEIVYNADGYYYLNKSNSVSKRRYILN
jgi:hypothetical protein